MEVLNSCCICWLAIYDNNLSNKLDSVRLDSQIATIASPIDALLHSNEWIPKVSSIQAILLEAYISGKLVTDDYFYKPLIDFFAQSANWKMPSQSRMSLEPSKSSKPCQRKTTSYSAYEAFMRSKDGHVEPKISSNKNVSTYCGDGTWTWDSDLHETGAAFNDDEHFSSHDITYVHPPISKEEIQEATSLSDIQPPSQISSSFYDDDYPQQIPQPTNQPRPVCSRESEDELFLKNYVPLSAKKKTTKTIFSVVQSMDNRDPFLPRTKDQTQQAPSQEATVQSHERKEAKIEQNLPKRKGIPAMISKSPVQTNVPVDTLIFHQTDLPTSKAFSTTMYLENGTSHFIGYKVFCNYKAALLFFVTPNTGIIPPKSQVQVLVKTKSLDEIVPREASELMINTKFMVKMFQMRDEMRLPACFNMLSKERPEHIFTQVIDKVVLSFPDNLDGSKSALDIVGIDDGEQYSQDSISGWRSLENLKSNGIQNMVLQVNQDMRRCLSLLIDINIFQKRMAWFIYAGSIPPLCLLYFLLKNYLSSN